MILSRTKHHIKIGKSQETSGRKTNGIRSKRECCRYVHFEKHFGEYLTAVDRSVHENCELRKVGQARLFSTKILEHS